MRMTWKLCNRQNDRERDWSRSEKLSMVRFYFDFYESSDSVIWKLSIISINIYCSKKNQGIGLRSLSLYTSRWTWLYLMCSVMIVNTARFWWDPEVCFVISWQMSGLIASRAVNFSLHQYDQNGCVAHIASCSVGIVGSAGPWSSLFNVRRVSMLRL